MWIDETPMLLLRSCQRMLPRLEAEENLLAAERIAIGQGRLPKGAHREISEQWFRVASPGADTDRPRTAAEAAGRRRKARARG